MKVLLILLLFNYALALEVDSFTNRHEPTQDSLAEFDLFVNKRIDKIIRKANRDSAFFGKSCHQWSLRRRAKKEFVSGIRGLFVTAPLQAYIDHGKLDSQYINKTPIMESIYRDISVLYKPMMKLLPFSPLVVTDDIILGSDKYSHFFNVGWIYFKRLYHGESVKSILKYGKSTEKVIWGGTMTGIISNADLVANFQGMRFFQHLFGFGVDPLTEVELVDQALIQCHGGQFVKGRQFTFRDYLDDGFDEGINCNDFSSKRMKKKVDKKMDLISASCPVDINRCEDLSYKYERYSKYLLHKKCR